MLHKIEPEKSLESFENDPTSDIRKDFSNGVTYIDLLWEDKLCTWTKLIADVENVEEIEMIEKSLRRIQKVTGKSKKDCFFIKDQELKIILTGEDNLANNDSFLDSENYIYEQIESYISLMKNLHHVHEKELYFDELVPEMIVGDTPNLNWLIANHMFKCDELVKNTISFDQLYIAPENRGQMEFKATSSSNIYSMALILLRLQFGQREVEDIIKLIDDKVSLKEKLAKTFRHPQFNIVPKSSKSFLQIFLTCTGVNQCIDPESSNQNAFVALFLRMLSFDPSKRNHLSNFIEEMKYIHDRLKENMILFLNLKKNEEMKFLIYLTDSDEEENEAKPYQKKKMSKPLI